MGEGGVQATSTAVSIAIRAVPSTPCPPSNPHLASSLPCHKIVKRKGLEFRFFTQPVGPAHVLFWICIAHPKYTPNPAVARWSYCHLFVGVWLEATFKTVGPWYCITPTPVKQNV